MRYSRTFALSLFLSTTVWAILPLPYPVEPWEEGYIPWQEASRDPKSIVGYSELFSGSQLREMELPDFQNPSGTLGYEPGATFIVTPALRDRVNFWKKIYSEYSSDQVVLHDSDYLNVIYGVIDVSEINGMRNLSYRKKQRLINRLAKREKEKIRDLLLTFHENQNDPLSIPLENFSIFSQFQNINEREKFLKARNRIRSQTGQRDKTVSGFFTGGAYFNKMDEIFEKAGIPKELTRLVLVESSFNLKAVSKVGASGIWQFMPSTGKRFLRIDRAVDERNDPIEATKAAAKLLGENYRVLESWPLAITAYNHGKAGMQRAIGQLGTRDFGKILDHYESSTFGFASKNFYPSFLAILEVEREYREHFGKLMVDSPLVYEEFPIPNHVYFREIAEACDVDPSLLAKLNLGLREWVLTGKAFLPKDYTLRLPMGKATVCQTNYRSISTVSNQ